MNCGSVSVIIWIPTVNSHFRIIDLPLAISQDSQKCTIQGQNHYHLLLSHDMSLMKLYVYHIHIPTLLGITLDFFYLIFNNFCIPGYLQYINNDQKDFYNNRFRISKTVILWRHMKNWSKQFIKVYMLWMCFSMAFAGGCLSFYNENSEHDFFHYMLDFFLILSNIWLFLLFLGKKSFFPVEATLPASSESHPTIPLLM